MSTLRRTPCVGICSTTYGDLVCRGCKRFAHEIVQWNAFDEEQRSLVRGRLESLRDGAVDRHVRILDEDQLRSSADDLRVADAAELSAATLAFEVLRRVSRRASDLADYGLAAAAGSNAAEVLEAIEKDFYQRSIARYERDFRTLAK